MSLRLLLYLNVPRVIGINETSVVGLFYPK